jgi:ferrous iron transport protein B
MPTSKSIVKHIWQKAKSYLKKMGGIILIASIIIWALGYFPQNKKMQQRFVLQIDTLKISYENKIQTADVNQKIVLQKELDSISNSLLLESTRIQQEKSFIGMIGKLSEPVFRPMGFDWKMSVAIISATSAKEIVVSTLSVLYQSGDENNLIDNLKTAKYDSGKNKGELIFTPPVALAFMVFVLLYFPCIATLVAVKQESGSWKWPMFMILYTTTVAWIFSFLVFKVSSLIF